MVQRQNRDWAGAGAAVARHRGHDQWLVLVAVLAASRERPEQVRWQAVLQLLQTNGLMLAAIVRLQVLQVILLWFLGYSRRVRADADPGKTG